MANSEARLEHGQTAVDLRLCEDNNLEDMNDKLG